MRNNFTGTDPAIRSLRKVVDTLFDTGQNGLADAILTACHDIQGRTIMGSLPHPNVLVGLTLLLEDQKIRFAIIGGIAVNVHGHSRATEDVDALVSKLPARTTDVEYMQKFGFYRSKSSTGTSQVLDSRSGGGVDLLLAQSSLDLWALKTAGQVSVLGGTVPVVTRDALVGLKLRAASSPSRKGKDLPDVLSVVLKGKVNGKTLAKYLTPQEMAELERLSR